MTDLPDSIGLIAGNGKFPLLVLDAARSKGMQVVVAAIKEETSPEIEQHGAAAVYWLSLGELSKLIETFKSEGITRAIMAGPGQAQADLQQHQAGLAAGQTAALAHHAQHRFADRRCGQGSQRRRHHADEFHRAAGADAGRRRRAHRSARPSDSEQTNITYGRAVAHHLSRFDIGQTVVIAEAACVAVEAMEGTDATILRAGEIMKSPSLGKEPSTLSRALTVVKVAKPNQDMRFDVPVVGLHTIETMKQAGASCLALDAGRCLLLDKEAVLAAANEAGICIVAETPVSHIPHHNV